MDKDTWRIVPSAGASSASADGTPVITATEYNQHMESTTELATSLRRTFEHQCANLHELLTFFMIALKDVGRSSQPISSKRML